MGNPTKNAKKKVLIKKYKSVMGSNLMITLYFSCLQKCTELLIVIFSSAAFLKSLFESL